MHIDVYAPGSAAATPGLMAKLRLRRQSVAAFGRLFLLGCLLAGASSFLLSGQWLAFFQMACFFGMGYLHVMLLRQSLALLNDAERWIYTSALTGILLLTQALFVYFAKRYAWPDLVINLCAFIIPFSVNEAWRHFADLSVGRPIFWFPTQDLAKQKSTTFLNSMPVRFSIQWDFLDRDTQRVSFRAPVRMKLGAIFYHMLQDQVRNGAKNDIGPDFFEQKGWAFYTTGFLGGIRYLDPEAGLLENGIAENGLIKARRISEVEALEGS